ncbi:MAG: cyclase family protein [Chloroflexota bacterium]|nr:cyclase family protein [Chloroflexota bacterium]
MSATDAELIALYERVDNTGRWGTEDELGTLNYITAPARVAAAGLVETGDVVSLAHPISPRESQPPGRVAQEMQYERPPDSVGVPWNAGDRITLEIHAASLTHVDCVSHIASHHHRVYNGRDYDAVAKSDGINHGSVFAQRGGIVTRGVLLDVPAARGIPWVPADGEVTVGDLEAAETHGRVRVRSGDVLVLRVGRAARIASEGGGGPMSPGPSADAIEWLHTRQVAAYAGDAPDRVTARGAAVLTGTLGEADSKAAPTQFIFPLHQVGIPAMGLVLFDGCAVEELAATCRRLGRYEFLFSAGPLPVRGGTGSAINPLAIF